MICGEITLILILFIDALFSLIYLVLRKDLFLHVFSLCHEVTKNYREKTIGLVDFITHVLTLFLYVDKVD